MPATIPDPRDWLAREIAAIKSDVAALKNQTTQYVVDASGVCQAIIGHLQYDQHGTATGLGDKWGIASHKTGSWVQL